MSAFAAVIIRSVRSNLQSFDDHPLSLSVHLAGHEDPDAVVNALPLLLLKENDDVVSCISHCIGLIARYEAFNLWNKVRLIRAQRG